MDDEIDVCHIVNKVSGSTIPADIATAQANLDGVSSVGICAWFEMDAFRSDSPVNTHLIDAPKGTRLGVSKVHLSKLRSVIEDYDIVHTHSNHSGLFGKIAARYDGLPVVSTEHNHHAGFTRKGRLANGLSNPLCEAITCVSESVYRSFNHWERLLLADDKVEVIYHGVSLDRIERSAKSNWHLHDRVDIDDEAVVVGNAAALTEQKNQETLIRAIGVANDRSSRPVELVISGEGPRRPALERTIKEAGIDHRVHLLGYLEQRDHVYQMMRECDLFAMCSRWEGFCVAVLEAMALGLPCILSDVDVFREVYGDVARYPRTNDHESLATEITKLADDADSRARMSERGVDLARSLTLEGEAEQYVDLYRSIM